MKLSDFIHAGREALIEDWHRAAEAAHPGLPRGDLDAASCHMSGILEYLSNAIRRDGDAKGPDGAAGYAECGFLGGREACDMISDCFLLKQRILTFWVARTAPDSEEMAELLRFDHIMGDIMLSIIAHHREQDTRARTLFLGTLVHDLKNPVNAILQSMQALPLAGPLNDTQAEVVRQISCSARGIDDLASKLIDTVRLKLGKGLALKLERASLSGIVRDAVGEVRAAHPGRDIRLDAAGDCDGDWDKIRMRELASNLIGNAAEHGADGPIDVALRQTDEGVSFSVHNTGGEIPPDILPKLFDPLVRGDGTVRGKANLGLGLFIAREIAKAHHGAIAVQSSKDDGVTFTVSLPCPEPYAAT